VLDKKILILKGNIIFAKQSNQLTIVENGFIVSRDGKVIGVFEQLPERYKNEEIIDYGDRIIIPGLADLHMHAPQLPFCGIGMDLQLLSWLEKYTFPEEAKYADDEYAEIAYEAFCKTLKASATTRAVIFATPHVSATNILMDKLEETGLCSFVGKVNMDRNCPDNLIELTDNSIEETITWVKEVSRKYHNTKPIITPRFVPTCTGELMEALGRIAKQYKVPVQSHLSENKNEVAWVNRLHPDIDTYSQVYDKFGLFGQSPTVMAHCIYLQGNELEMLKNNGVYVAHCPQSNINLSSGIAPVREMLERGISVGLGTDIAAGFSMSVLRSMSDAIQVSKLYAVLVDNTKSPLTLAEAFYMATKGGGSFWGKVGSFEADYDMDAVVLDDQCIESTREMTLQQRLERIVYLMPECRPTAKYVNGIKII